MLVPSDLAVFVVVFNVFVSFVSKTLAFCLSLSWTWHQKSQLCTGEKLSDPGQSLALNDSLTMVHWQPFARCLPGDREKGGVVPNSFPEVGSTNQKERRIKLQEEWFEDGKEMHETTLRKETLMCSHSHNQHVEFLPLSGFDGTTCHWWLPSARE